MKYTSKETFFEEGPQQMLGCTTALRLIVQTCDKDEEKDDDYFFPFFQVMEHRWDETYRGKPTYSGKNLSQCHFVHRKSHMD